ncbi:MAG: hypothetical protein BWK75_01245 [Candidatus Altiarchaeales archaeon A3]|nr:MAG: hypothetical protein BWK75_01245 [Candidatus Altiarchaeales archaeon A3]
MENMKSINMVWLSKANLSNINAGEGSGNVTELKTYDKGRKPYASGQSVRHALRQSIERAHPDVYKCVPELPCGNVNDCWLCDLFGYLNPKKGEGSDRRWSALKVSPALGQIRTDIVTDMLTRHSIQESKENEEKYEKIAELEKELENKKDNAEESNKIKEEIDKIKGSIKDTKDQRIAHVQLMENIYKIGVVIDYDNIGKVLVPEGIFTGKKEVRKFKNWKIEINIGDDQRKERAKSVLDGIMNLSDFAKQARNMVSFSPDIVIVSLQNRYNHRLMRALDLDDNGKINKDELEVILKDIKQCSEILVGYTPGVISKESESDLYEALKKGANIEKQDVKTPFEAIKDAINKI